MVVPKGSGECVYTYMYVCLVYVFMYVYACVYACVYVYMCVHLCVCVHVCTSALLCTVPEGFGLLFSNGFPSLRPVETSARFSLDT